MEAGETLWKNKNWAIQTRMKPNGKLGLMVIGHGNNVPNHVDYPIMYDNNDRIAFDNPYVVPRYVQEQVYVEFRKLKRSR